MSLALRVETPRGILVIGTPLPASGATLTSPSFEPAAGSSAIGGISGAGAETTGAAFFLGAAFFSAVGAGEGFF
jgi:hypothetical protein